MILSNSIIGQNYCLTINPPVDNGSTVAYAWSISTGSVSLAIDASIFVEGTGDLSGSTDLIGGTNSSSYSGTIILAKPGSTGIFDISITFPFGPVITSNNGTTVNSDCSFLLPITLTTFSAKKYSDRASKLDWITASEINSDYFEIERSRDGDVWETIGKIAAAGNSQQELNYSFIDDQLAMTRSNNNMFYYRLKLADLDGTFKYSDVKGVNFSNEYTGIIRIYPNPTAEQINVDLGGTEQSDLEKTDISVYDMKGQKLLFRKVSGFGIELIETQNLPASTYNVVVRQGDKIHQQRVIKID